MKKALTFIIGILMVLSLCITFQTNILAASTDYTVEISGPTSIVCGQNVEYTISLTDINSQRGGLLGADIELSFDTDVFSYGSVTIIETPSGWAINSVNKTQASDGTIIFVPVYESGAMTGIIADNAIKYKISFKVNETDIKSTLLSFTRLEGSGADYNAYYGSSTGLTVSVDKKYPGPAAPSAPEKSTQTATSITLKPADGYEYKCNEGAWQDSNVFTCLKPNTEYSFYQRVKETATIYRSESSKSVKISTLPVSSCRSMTSGYVAGLIVIILIMSKRKISNIK